MSISASPFAAYLSHWLIENRRSGAARRLVVAAESAGEARRHAEDWRQSRPYEEAAALASFFDQRHYLVRRLPDGFVDSVQGRNGLGGSVLVLG